MMESCLRSRDVPRSPGPLPTDGCFTFPHHEKRAGWECPREVTRRISGQGGKGVGDKSGLGWRQCPENQRIT